ncbi:MULTISPECIES: LacI family DNA-binding transcriptional regulator [unclassified Rathayibacter]|uniref:LacI family DNA-binding transcriptional regulator n=1 Tax=unclassified Rathayibacter TaxID=2609250 RepID=UPI0006F81F3E|nr:MULTISPECIES: LacI family DNA-binding transcriptional regulator [unclassified Rathayibacter]KQQ05665.1 LacI family transcriptional regulator [Rathayibacter sp. Leaf294]KQS13524.1 LacI family transcriptional regulator [Rathayibacter sp. Leaf185]
MAEPRRKATLASVAESAGVSLKTASNAVNGTGRMTDETRARVKAAVEELGYTVNIAARSLTRGRTDAISLAVPTLKAAYLAELAEAVIETARDMSLAVYVTTYPDDGGDGSRRLLQRFDSQRTDGLLLSLSEHETLDRADFDVAYPLVCLGTRHTWDLVDRVTTDDVADARAAAAHLLERGSRTIAVVGAHAPFDPEVIGTAREGNAELRLRGVSEEAAAAGRALDPRLVGVTGYDWTIGSGFRVARDLVRSGLPFDGLVCFNDQLATGAISALREGGLRIPEDVQVIGFDNVEESAFLTPPLTSMDSRIEWIARTSLERLVARIESADAAPTTVFARSRLITRGTTR